MSTAPVAPPRLPPKPQTGTILALGITSIVVCGILGFIAFSMGKGELARIDRGELPDKDRSAVQAGYVCGIIGMCVLVLQLLIIMSMS